MNPPIDADTAADGRLEWIEPQVRALAVGETTATVGFGADGEVMWADCTRS